MEGIDKTSGSASKTYRSKFCWHSRTKSGLKPSENTNKSFCSSGRPSCSQDAFFESSFGSALERLIPVILCVVLTALLEMSASGDKTHANLIHLSSCLVFTAIALTTALICAANEDDCCRMPGARDRCADAGQFPWSSCFIAFGRLGFSRSILLLSFSPRRVKLAPTRPLTVEL